MVRVQVNDVRLWYDVLAPQVVLEQEQLVERLTVIGVHGGPGIDSTSLLGTLAPLGDVAQLIRFDQRGHGRSDHGQPLQWTLDTWADDLAGFVEVLGVDNPVLFGTSYGAHVALACAARYPQLVRGVVAAYGGGRLDEQATVEAFRRLGGDQAAQVAAGDPEDSERGFREWLRVCWPLCSRSATGVARLERLQRLSIHSPDVHAAAAGSEVQLMPGLDRVTCPVLVLGGRDDPLSTPSSMTELAAALTGSKRCDLILIADAGHTLFADQPQQAYAAVRDWLTHL